MTFTQMFEASDELENAIREPQGQRIYAPYAAQRVRDRFVVIDRNDLPAIVSQDPGLFGTVHGHERVALEPSWHRDLAMHHLAIAQHRESLPPPVDEKAVDELQDALIAHPFVPHESARSLARSLVADGWKREVGS